MTAHRPKRVARRTGGRELVVTARDLALMSTLAWARYLTTTQLERLFFPSRRRAQKRLRALFDRGFIAAHLQGGVLYRDNVFTLARAGHALLVARGALPDGERVSLRPPRLPRLRHALTLRNVFCELMLAERQGAFVLEDVRFDEDLASEPVFVNARLIPDVFATLVRGERRIMLGVEVDLGTEASRVLAAKLDGWRALARIGVGDGVLVLLVAVARSRRHTTLAALVANAGLDCVHRVALLDELGDLFGAAWPFALGVRAGRTDRPPVGLQMLGFRPVSGGGRPVFRAPGAHETGRPPRG